MKLGKLTLTIIAAMGLQACSTIYSLLPNSAPLASLEQPDSIKPQTIALQGALNFQQSRAIFTPCGSEQHYQLQLSSRLMDKITQNTTPSFAPRPVPMTVWGHFSAPGRSDDIQSVNDNLSIDNSLEIDDNTVIDDSAISADNIAIDAHFNVKQLTVNDQFCEKSDQVPEDGNWVGSYQSEANETPLVVTLELHQDHSMLTRYHYTNGEPDSLESGYWQPLNSEQIQVVITHFQDQYLLSDRLFIRDGDTLRTDKERVGEQVYPIANGGLQLQRNEE